MVLLVNPMVMARKSAYVRQDLREFTVSKVSDAVTLHVNLSEEAPSGSGLVLERFLCLSIGDVVGFRHACEPRDGALNQASSYDGCM